MNGGVIVTSLMRFHAFAHYLKDSAAELVETQQECISARVPLHVPSSSTPSTASNVPYLAYHDPRANCAVSNSNSSLESLTVVLLFVYTCVSRTNVEMEQARR